MLTYRPCPAQVRFKSAVLLAEARLVSDADVSQSLRLYLRPASDDHYARAPLLTQHAVHVGPGDAVAVPLEQLTPVEGVTLRGKVTRVRLELYGLAVAGVEVRVWARGGGARLGFGGWGGAGWWRVAV